MMTVESRWVSQLAVNRSSSRDPWEASVFHQFFIGVSFLTSLREMDERIRMKAAAGIHSAGQVNARYSSNESENMPRICQACPSAYGAEGGGGDAALGINGTHTSDYPRGVWIQWVYQCMSASRLSACLLQRLKLLLGLETFHSFTIFCKTEHLCVLFRETRSTSNIWEMWECALKTKCL